MSLFPSIQSTLWRSNDWRADLQRMVEGLTEDASDGTAALAVELGHALELVEPDRTRALAMFVVAARGGRDEAVPHVRRLAQEVGAHELLAELALAAYRESRELEDLVAAIAALFDAGQPARAVAPLEMAVGELPDHPRLRSLLAAAQHAVRDPHDEVSRWIAHAARADAELQPALYLHAARLARALGLDELLAQVLTIAVERRLGAPLGAMAEARLLERGDGEALLALYRGALADAPDHAAWVEVAGTAAIQLVLRGRQPGLGLRLARSGLEQAYRQGVATIRGHLGLWALLLAHARETRATLELMPLVVAALAHPLPDDERLFLARVGFEIAWHDARDVDAARPYASMVIELVPDHPTVGAFVARELPALLGGNDEDDAMLRALANLGASTELVSLDLGARREVDVPVTGKGAPLLPSPVAPRAAAVAAPTPPPDDGFELDIDVDEEASAPASPIPAAAAAALRGGRGIGVPAAPPLRAGAADRAPRKVVPIDVVFRVGDGAPVPAVARDISASGLFLATSVVLPDDASVALELRLPGATALAVTRHRVTARVMRRAPAGYGLMFEAPSAELVAAIRALAGDAS